MLFEHIAVEKAFGITICNGVGSKRIAIVGVRRAIVRAAPLQNAA